MNQNKETSIRTGQFDDLSQIIVIKKAFDGLRDQDQVDYQEYYQYLLKEGIIIVACSSNEVVGYIAAELNGSICYVSDAGVNINFQNSGVFCALAKELEQRIRNHGTRRVICHIKESNPLMMEILERKLHFRRGDRYILFSREVD